MSGTPSQAAAAAMPTARAICLSLGAAHSRQDAEEVVHFERAILGEVSAVHGILDLGLAVERAQLLRVQVRRDLRVVRAAQLAHREHWIPLAHSNLGELLFERSGFRLSEASGGFAHAGPNLGEPNDTNLREPLGLGRVRRLRGAGRTDGSLVVVANVTSLTRNGLADFVLQRVSAIVIALYTLCVLGFFLANPGVTHAQLVAYFGSTPMLVFSTVLVFSTAAHAWIGMWTIGTDYIRNHYFGSSATVFRFVYQTGCMMLLFLYVVWALQIFWSL